MSFALSEVGFNSINQSIIQSINQLYGTQSPQEGGSLHATGAGAHREAPGPVRRQEGGENMDKSLYSGFCGKEQKAVWQID